MLVPKDSMAATVPATGPSRAAVSPEPAPSADHRSGGSSPADPCADGCKADIGSFKMVKRYQYPHPTFGTLKCDEKVFELTAGWPGGPYLHSVVCDGPNARGVPVTLINFRLAKSDRVKDEDVTIFFDNATGVGKFLGADRHPWRVKIYGTGSVESMSIEILPL